MKICEGKKPISMNKISYNVAFFIDTVKSTLVTLSSWLDSSTDPWTGPAAGWWPGMAASVCSLALFGVLLFMMTRR